MTGPLLPQAGRIQTAGLQEFQLGTPGTPDRRFLGLRSGVLMFFIYWTCFYESPHCDPCSEFVAHASPFL